MKTIYLASLCISYFRKITQSKNRNCWVKWRDMMPLVTDHKNINEVKGAMNQGVGDLRKIKNLSDIVFKLNQLGDSSKSDCFNFILLFLEIEKQFKDSINEKNTDPCSSS